MKAVLQNYIGGQFRPATAAAEIIALNPSDATDEVARFSSGTPGDAQAAVAAAADAYPRWRRMSGPVRAEHLYRWAAVIDARREELAQALTRDVGKPISESRGEIARCSVILRYYAGDAVRERGDVVPAQGEGMLQFTLREPLGVVALITPWNFPAAIPLWKTAPALAFGNTVVLKPAEQASRVATLLADTATAAELPAGVFNVVLGGGGSVGAALVEADDVAAVSFTGSTAIGMQVAAACARRNIRYQTEMGGKNVVIVLADADLDLAARLTAAGAMRYAGQKCTATSRAVVAKEVEADFVERLRAQVQALPIGPVTDAAAAIGPLINNAARVRVQDALRAATAECVYGGKVPNGDAFARGYFVDPTIFRAVDPSSPLAQDELFGPVLATFTAHDLDDAIALANRTRYGLSASIFTRDLRAALTYIDRIEAGLVRVNGDTTGVDPHAPFGGVKASSSGSREQGSAAREFYTEIKTVQLSG
jgi:acyl-CoA reductase-like NAD-dependent aldehyde dehydrogenase